ncbi:MAG: hypothetical protein A3E01_09215 [Gammaproteobacteria bacterium RIFCSPHIGHO2_12_FULL_63_22]|nr:MAG: hypothetical protein A3E01_09215 [Gammaproteobacteria bacterium RIFCSPHIGHO2_12_FULL_63_22]
MAVVADRVVVELEARLDRYEANLVRADQKFDRAMGNIQKNAAGTERVVSRAAGVMGAALAGVSVVALAKGFLGLADEAKNLDAQLKLATRESGSFAQAQKDVLRIANETRSGLAEAAALYGTFQRNAKQLGITQLEAARTTETITKAFQISGATAAEAAGGVRQLLQGIQSGTLRGEELNSVLENAPRLAKALADGLGVTIGQLRAMGAEGEITGKKVIDALAGASKQIDAEFKQLPVTFDQAMTRVHNAAVTTFGAFDRGGEFSTALANFVSDGSDGFDGLADKAEQFGITVRSELTGLIAVGKEAYSVISGIIGLMESIGNSGFGRFVQGVNDVAQNLNPFGFGMRGIGNSSAFQNARGDTRQRLENNATDRKWQGLIESILPGVGIDGKSKDTGTPAITPTGTGRTKKGPKSPLDADAFAREEAALNDRILGLKSNEITDAEERAAIDLQRIEAGRQATIKEIAADDRYTALQKQQVSALTNTVAAIEAASVIRKREEAILERQYDLETDANRGAQDLARSSLDLTANRREQYEIEKRILKLKQSQERAEYERLIQSRDQTDVLKGQAGLARLDASQANERKALAQQYESPLDRYARGLTQTDTQDRIESYVVDELQSVQEGIAGALQKAIGTKDPLISGLINLLIEQVIMRPLAEALAGASGGGGGSGLLGVIATVGSALLGFAGGGSFQIGGRGGTDRNTLSLNGRPIANVSRGETVNVSNSPLSRGGGGTTVVRQTFVLDARYGITTPELINYVNQTASQEGQKAYASAVRDTPIISARRQRFGS